MLVLKCKTSPRIIVYVTNVPFFPIKYIFPGFEGVVVNSTSLCLRWFSSISVSIHQRTNPTVLVNQISSSSCHKSAHFLLTRLCCCPWTHLWFWWVQRCFHTRHVSRDYLVKKLHYFRCVARNPFPVFCDDKVLSSAQVKILGKFSIFPLWLLYCQVHETANLITSWALIC